MVILRRVKVMVEGMEIVTPWYMDDFWMSTRLNSKEIRVLPTGVETEYYRILIIQILQHKATRESYIQDHVTMFM